MKTAKKTNATKWHDGALSYDEWTNLMKANPARAKKLFLNNAAKIKKAKEKLTKRKLKTKNIRSGEAEALGIYVLLLAESMGL